MPKPGQVIYKKQKPSENPMAGFAAAAAAAAEKPEPTKTSDVNNQLPKDFKTWFSFYPAYIDSNKTLQEGRRIKKELCVPQPSIKDVMIAAKALGLKFVSIPSKRYPRDFFNPGKMFVCIKNNETGEFINPNIVDRNSMYENIATKLKDLRANYKERIETIKAEEDAMKAEKKAKKDAKKTRKGKK